MSKHKIDMNRSLFNHHQFLLTKIQNEEPDKYSKSQNPDPTAVENNSISEKSEEETSKNSDSSDCKSSINRMDTMEFHTLMEQDTPMKKLFKSMLKKRMTEHDP